jgi:dienelactone hydrolase
MRRLISAALAASFTLLILPTFQATVAGADTCASDYTVLVGGTGDPNSANVPFQTIGQPVRVQYPADVIRSDMSVAAGVRGTANAVARVRRDCPGAAVHVAGYSLGAWVAGDYCNTDPSVSCTLVADPRRPGGLASYLPDLPGITLGGARPAAGNINSVCGEYDIICSAPANDPVRLAASALGYAAGIIGRSTHGYAPVVEPAGDVVVSQPSPIPFTDEVPALPFQVPAPRDVVQPWVPERSMVAGGGYVPVPVEQFLPDVVNSLLPAEVRGWVPPPLPVIPGL